MRITKAQRWTAYVAIMRGAEKAALDFADAAERFLRHENTAWWQPYYGDACRAAERYHAAVQRAEPFHFGTIRAVTASDVLNANAAELLAMVRAIRGTPVPVTLTGEDGRRLAAFRYADDGLAGFFRLEVRSMRRYGAPRRDPGGWEEIVRAMSIV